MKLYAKIPSHGGDSRRDVFTKIALDLRLMDQI
jgi:hypothetical protein